MKLFRYASVAAAALFIAAPAMAQETQALTYEVQAIDELSVTGTPTLVISTATAGSEPDADSDATSTYAITTNGTNKRITVALSAAPVSDVTLTALLAAPTGGTASTVTFTDAYMANTAKDAVTGITEVAEDNLSITYEVSAPVTAGVVAEQSVTVTYTIADGV